MWCDDNAATNVIYAQYCDPFPIQPLLHPLLLLLLLLRFSSSSAPLRQVETSSPPLLPQINFFSLAAAVGVAVAGVGGITIDIVKRRLKRPSG